MNHSNGFAKWLPLSRKGSVCEIKEDKVCHCQSDTQWDLNSFQSNWFLTASAGQVTYLCDDLELWHTSDKAFAGMKRIFLDAKGLLLCCLHLNEPQLKACLHGQVFLF